MALSSEKIAKKITSGSYKSLQAARAGINRTKLKTQQKNALLDVANEYFKRQNNTAPSDASSQSESGSVDSIPLAVTSEPAANKLLAADGRAYSATAEPAKILQFDERLTQLAFQFLSVAIDFKLTKEELGRRLAAKIRSV